MRTGGASESRARAMQADRPASAGTRHTATIAAAAALAVLAAASSAAAQESESPPPAGDAAKTTREEAVKTSRYYLGVDGVKTEIVKNKEGYVVYRAVDKKVLKSVGYSPAALSIILQYGYK